MKKIENRGFTFRNIGLLILLLSCCFFFTSGLIYMVNNNPMWFSRAAVASIILGLYLNADK